MANLIDKVVARVAQASCFVYENQPLCEAARRHEAMEAVGDYFEHVPSKEGADRSFIQETLHLQVVAFQGLRNLLRPGCDFRKVEVEEKK